VVFLQPQFSLISFVQQLHSSGRKEATFLAHIGSAATAGRSMDHLFLYPFLLFHFFNNYTLSDNIGLAWVWPVKGVFLVTFSFITTSSYHCGLQ
jgi:hypothetical protein